MKEKNITVGYLVIGLIIGSILTAITVTVLNRRTAIGMMGFQTQNRAMMGNTDRHFIEQMIPHHEDAITMARVAMKKAQHQEVRKLAQNIIKTQQEENTQMKEWYRTWYREDVPEGELQIEMPEMIGRGRHMGMMGDETDLISLQNAEDFDKEFIEQMIPHHQMAIMMASMLERGTNKEEMKELAKNIISTQTKEIISMRSWYNNWFK